MNTRKTSAKDSMTTPQRNNIKTPEATTTKKDRKKPNKPNTIETPEDNGGKQVTIDSMLTPVINEVIPDIDLKQIMDMIKGLEVKMNTLASEEYINQALNKRLDNIISKETLESSLQSVKCDISNELKSELDKVYNQLKTVKTKVTEFSNEIEIIKNQTSDNETKLQKVVDENEKLKARNKELNEKINSNYDRVKHNEFQLNDLEQYTRRNSVRIYGIDDRDRFETTETTTSLVIKLLHDKLGLTAITPADIDIAHRLGRFTPEGNRPVICKFVHRFIKHKVIQVRKQLKGSQYVIREDLTGKNAKLLESLSAKPEVKNCWSDDGKIIAILNNDRKIKVDLFTDLSKSLVR